MSKRPTFLDLILAFGYSEFELGAAVVKTEDERRLVREKRDAARDELRRALRKAGVPLDQVAP